MLRVGGEILSFPESPIPSGNINWVYEKTHEPLTNQWLKTHPKSKMMALEEPVPYPWKNDVIYCPKNCFLSLPKRLQKDHQTQTSGLPKWKCKCLKRFRWTPQCLNCARIYKCYHILKVYPLKLLELNLNHTLLANILGQSKIEKVITVFPALIGVPSVSLQLVASSCSIKQRVSSKYQNKKPCDKSLSHTVTN